ncbi:pilus assembly protein TadG-related protein [Rhodopirellula baltica]|uniref:pilus assembly protein TadG-related protein n=1 Tax=Rhodopirellula baltica TaxID=265606 RepID=UPI001F2E7F94|nr:pilus assembly protein TadG-related protein [Rhodopirellula baltica]
MIHSLPQPGDHDSSTFCVRRSRRVCREGKILVSMAILLPTLLAFTGLVFDGGLIATDQWVQQHATDSAATAAALNVLSGQSDQLSSIATDVVANGHSLPSTNVVVHRPPSQGAYQGDMKYVEVVTMGTYGSRFINLFGGLREHPMVTRSVAGVDSVNPGAAIMILDPDPAPLSIADLPTLLQDLGHLELRSLAVNQYELGTILDAVPLLSAVIDGVLQNELLQCTLDATTDVLDEVASNTLALHLPALTAGLEIEGLGYLEVDGSVHVNNAWGGVDERGRCVGDDPGYPNAVACMPLLSTTRLKAEHIRVVGGVDREHLYLPLDDGGHCPLQANRAPVPNPLESLPSPLMLGAVSGVSAPETDIVGVTLSASGAEVVLDEILGGLSFLLKPVFDTVRDPIEHKLCNTTYSPGVYRSMTVIAPTGGVTFEPGVYVICGKNPVTEISLCLLGPIQAEGVLFYITDEASFDSDGNFVEETSGDGAPGSHEVTNIVPSVVIAPLLPGGKLTGLNSPGNPLNEMLIFQHPTDRRPIVMECQQLIGNNALAGTVYAKWGHVQLVAASAELDLKIASGTARVVTVGTTRLSPKNLFPAAQDVFLVE